MPDGLVGHVAEQILEGQDLRDMRAFMSSPEHLGQYVVADYANMHNSIIR